MTLLRGTASPSQAGPYTGDFNDLKPIPQVPGNKYLQTMRFSVRQASFVARANREYGDVFRIHGMLAGRPVLISHPDHIKSLFTAKPELVPTIAAESPLRPILGPNSTLTANGARHLRQRKLLLPPFHGEAIKQYSGIIERAAEREIARWNAGETYTLAPRAQSITLDVIMAGIFGVDERPPSDSPEGRLRRNIKHLMEISTWPVAQVFELMNTGYVEPVGVTKFALTFLDREVYSVIRKRRAEGVEGRHDILSLLLQATTEDGHFLNDRELRDEILTIVLAGHETTANQISWTLERLVRTPDAYERLRSAIDNDVDASATLDATIYESMRARPVIPTIGRRVTVPWQLGEYGVEANTAIAISVLLTHHRPDLYPEPKAFKPERFLEQKPGTYTWIPFGGGTRRCLGAALAHTEMKIVLKAMFQHCDFAYERPEAERFLHRNVTMIPDRGCRIRITNKR